MNAKTKATGPAPARSGQLPEGWKAHPFLRDLSAKQLATLEECAVIAEFEPGQVIFREGEMANRFYLLQEGAVALESRSPERDAIHIQTIGAGDVLGWSWLFPPYVWHFDARAIEPVSALSIHGTRLRECCDADHELGYELIRRMAEAMMERLHATRRQLSEISALAMRSQWEALSLAAQLGMSPQPTKKRFRAAAVTRSKH